MLIRWCAHRLGEAEHEVANVLARVPRGLVLMGVVLPGRGGREIDALVVRPDRVVTIEAKGTSLSGAVTIPANGPWLVGGVEADFAGGANPLSQTRVQAQRLRALCNEADVRVGFVPAIAVVVGDVELAPSDVAGGVSATDLDHLPEALDRLGHGRRLSRDDVRRFLALLDLGTATPDEAALDAAGFPRDDGSIPDAVAEPVVAEAPASSWHHDVPVPAPPPPQRYVPPQYAPQYVPQWAPPPPPQYGYYGPPPRARRPPRRGRPQQYRPRSPYDTWPPYRHRRDARPPRRKRRNPLVSLLKLLLVAWLVVLLLGAAAQLSSQLSPSPTPSPTPHRRPPATRTRAPR